MAFTLCLWPLHCAYDLYTVLMAFTLCLWPLHCAYDLYTVLMAFTLCFWPLHCDYDLYTVLLAFTLCLWPLHCAYDLYTVLMAFEWRGSLLWHGTSVYTVSSEGPPRFVTSYEKPGVLRTYSNGTTASDNPRRVRPDSMQTLDQRWVGVGVVGNTSLLACWHWPNIGPTLKF